MTTFKSQFFLFLSFVGQFFFHFLLFLSLSFFCCYPKKSKKLKPNYSGAEKKTRKIMDDSLWINGFSDITETASVATARIIDTKLVNLVDWLKLQNSHIFNLNLSDINSKNNNIDSIDSTTVIQQRRVETINVRWRTIRVS